MFNDHTDGLFRRPGFKSHKETVAHAFCRPSVVMIWSAPAPVFFLGVFYRMGYVPGEEQPDENFDWTTLKPYQNPRNGLKEFYYQAPVAFGEYDQVLAGVRRHFCKQAEQDLPPTTWKQGRSMFHNLASRPIIRQLDDVEVRFKNVVHKRTCHLGENGLYHQSESRLYYEMSIDGDAYIEGVADVPYDPTANYITYLMNLLTEGQ